MLSSCCLPLLQFQLPASAGETGWPDWRASKSRPLRQQPYSVVMESLSGWKLEYYIHAWANITKRTQGRNEQRNNAAHELTANFLLRRAGVNLG